LDGAVVAGGPAPGGERYLRPVPLHALAGDADGGGAAAAETGLRARLLERRRAEDLEVAGEYDRSAAALRGAGGGIGRGAGRGGRCGALFPLPRGPLRSRRRFLTGSARAP